MQKTRPDLQFQLPVDFVLCKSIRHMSGRCRSERQDIRSSGPVIVGTHLQSHLGRRVDRFDLSLEITVGVGF